MSDYSFGNQGSSMTGKQKSDLIEQVKAQVAIANAQELLQRISNKCFKKCICKPGTSLDSSDQKCLLMCMDRYMDAYNVVSKTYQMRLQREHSSAMSSGSLTGFQ